MAAVLGASGAALCARGPLRATRHTSAHGATIGTPGGVAVAAGPIGARRHGAGGGGVGAASGVAARRGCIVVAASGAGHRRVVLGSTVPSGVVAVRGLATRCRGVGSDGSTDAPTEKELSTAPAVAVEVEVLEPLESAAPAGGASGFADAVRGAAGRLVPGGLVLGGLVSGVLA